MWKKAKNISRFIGESIESILVESDADRLIIQQNQLLVSCFLDIVVVAEDIGVLVVDGLST